jgi:hypothetical protein
MKITIEKVNSGYIVTKNRELVFGYYVIKDLDQLLIFIAKEAENKSVTLSEI